MSGVLRVSLAFDAGGLRPVGRLAERAGRIYFEADKGFLAAPLPLSRPFAWASVRA